MPTRSRARQSRIDVGVHREAILGCLDPAVAKGVRADAKRFGVYPSWVVNEACAIVRGMKLVRGSYKEADRSRKLRVVRKKKVA